MTEFEAAERLSEIERRLAAVEQAQAGVLAVAAVIERVDRKLDYFIHQAQEGLDRIARAHPEDDDHD